MYIIIDMKKTAMKHMHLPVEDL